MNIFLNLEVASMTYIIFMDFMLENKKFAQGGFISLLSGIGKLAGSSWANTFQSNFNNWFKTSMLFQLESHPE